MAVVYHEIYLPIDTESTFDYIVIKQGDAGTHRVRATLISNNRVYTIPTSGASYFMKFRKPDNNYCLVEATVSDNTISAEVTEEMLRVSGTGRGEFMIVSGSNELKTSTFHVKIVKETFTSGDVQSHSDFAPFAALLQGAGAAASNANAAAAVANAAASLAEQKAQAIPDDYSELVADVAGKADKSTTYTKNEVDQKISDVEVETDTTLEVAGAPADAAETGRQIGLLKADLGALNKPQRLADGTDLDTVLTPGVYMLHTANSYINKPTSDSEHGILEVWHEDFGDNQGRVFQRLTYTYKAGRTCTEIWTRSLGVATMTWTPWVSIVNTDELNRNSLLLNEVIPDTTQSYTFTDGRISQIVHSRNSSAVRTDSFTYGTGTITEVRTLASGESLTIVTNLTTLETTITYTEE